jgi:hypothetical protein
MTTWDELLSRYGLLQILEGLAEACEAAAAEHERLADSERGRAHPRHVAEHAIQAEWLRVQAAMLIHAAANIEMSTEDTEYVA